MSICIKDQIQNMNLVIGCTVGCAYGKGTTVAHHIEYCTWSFVHEKLGLTYGTHQVEITGSVSNKTTFSVS